MWHIVWCVLIYKYMKIGNNLHNLEATPKHPEEMVITNVNNSELLDPLIIRNRIYSNLRILNI